MPTTPATRKAARPTARTATTPTTHTPAPPAPKTSVDYLEEALKDLGKAREKGGNEIRASIDAAMERVREAGKELGTRTQDQVGDWQKALDALADDALRELGLMTIRAQHSPEALTEFSAEIRKRRGQLSRRATADRRRATADRVTA
jgi:ElaB/YqjD/DUF883 family membrane-anchored ribosome-binding protein